MVGDPSNGKSAAVKCSHLFEAQGEAGLVQYLDIKLSFV